MKGSPEDGLNGGRLVPRGSGCAGNSGSLAMTAPEAAGKLLPASAQMAASAASEDSVEAPRAGRRRRSCWDPETLGSDESCRPAAQSWCW